MAGMRLATLVRRLRREATAPAESSDADLLARFIHARDDAAFELLVWRHGALVLAACQRILAHSEDAEDAFQAVFLVLARKAHSVARGAALPAWLHRVAVRIAARLARSRRPTATLPGEPQGKPDPDRVTQSETLGALDEEVNRLSERHRRAVVLCYLEGLSAAEAARQLGCPTGTVESRLAVARKKLRDQLTRRGVTLPAGILAVAGHAVLAPEAVARTARASVDFAREGAIANELTAQLARRVLIMWQARKWASVMIITIFLMIGAGIGWANWPDGPRLGPVATALPPAPAPQAKDDPSAPVEDWPFAQRMRGVAGLITGIAPDGRTLVIRDHQQVFGLDLTEKHGRNSLSFRIVAQNPISDAAVSPDGKYVATAEAIHGVKLRDAATRKVIEAFWPSGKLPTYHVAFTQDGTRLVALSERRSTSNPGKGSGGKGGRWDELRNAKITVQVQISVWDLTTRKDVGFPVESTTVSQIVESGVTAPDYQLAENGRFVLKHEAILVQRKPTIREGPREAMPQAGERAGFRFTIIDTTTGKSSQPMDVKEPNLSLFSRSTISPDAKTIVAMDVANRNNLHLFDATSGKKRAKLSPLLRPIQAVTFSADGKLLAAASGRTNSAEDAEIAAPSEVVIWEVATGKELSRVSDKESIRDYTALRFSPDGKFIVAQESQDGSYTFWGHPPHPQPDPIKPPVEAKDLPTPRAGVPDRFRTLFQDLSADGVTDQRRVEGVFLAALGRLPTDVELRTLTAQFARQTDKAAALGDLLKTLIDTAEFKAHAAELSKLSK